tara:strand:- start:1782 stop:1982 length:201 start_codon:yes stop_codon:yes gene_type:complete
MRNIKWILFIFEDLERTKLLKSYEFKTIKEIAYILDMKQQDISNYFHGLIKERDVLRYCYIYQVGK